MTGSLCIAHGGDVSEPSGGTDRVTALAGGLRERGHDVHLVVPDPASDLPERLADVVVHPVATGGRLLAAPRSAGAVIRRARRVARRKGARLQLEHSTLAGLAALRGTDGFVLDMHDLAFARFDHVNALAAPLLKRGTAWLERHAVRSASHVIVVSEVMRDVVVDRWGVPSSAVAVVPNGYFPDRIASVCDVPTVDGRVCFLGTLHPKVDVDAFERVADLPAVSDLVVIGDGARRRALERRAASNDSLRVTGRLSDREAFELLAGAVVAINPQHESLLQRASSPVKLYYYAALGLPMVVAPGPAVVADLAARDALVTARGDRAVAAAVERLLENPGRRATIGGNAREAAKAFEWSARIDALSNRYNRLSRN